jgi:hypothetical protein
MQGGYVRKQAMTLVCRAACAKSYNTPSQETVSLDTVYTVQFGILEHPVQNGVGISEGQMPRE